MCNQCAIHDKSAYSMRAPCAIQAIQSSQSMGNRVKSQSTQSISNRCNPCEINRCNPCAIRSLFLSDYPLDYMYIGAVIQLIQLFNDLVYNYKVIKTWPRSMYTRGLLSEMFLKCTHRLVFFFFCKHFERK